MFNKDKYPIYAEEIKIDSRISLDYLTAWLNMLWLRPATALQKALEAKHLHKFLPFKEPVADLGCGDGTHSSLIAGCRYGIKFDMYSSIANMVNDLSLNQNKGVHFKKANTTGDYFSGGDPYLYFDKDSILSSFEKTLDKNFSFEWGCDLSKDLVEKAKLLNLYKEVVVHDLSKPLPLPDKSFSTIYSNVSYWMNDKDTLFSEHKRILKDDGVALMTAQDPIIHEELALTTIARKYSKHLGHSSDPEWLKQLDRGRIDQTKGLLLNEEEWRGLFEKSGLEILYFGKFMSRDAYWHYDTDLRETFPSDVNLAQNLTKIGSDGQRLRDNWKKNRVDHYLNKWKPFFNDNNDWQKDIPRSWNFFVIKIKNNISWPEKI